MASRPSQADFIEVRYSRFHKLHGKNVVLSEDGCSARRERGYDRAVVFSSYPIPVGSRFQLAIEGIEQQWSGSLVSLRVRMCACCTVPQDEAARLTTDLISVYLSIDPP